MSLARALAGIVQVTRFDDIVASLEPNVVAFWKLAAIVEGAYAQYVTGQVDTEYARALADDVPALLREAAGFAAGA